MNVVDEIKQKLDIVDIVSQYIKLQKSGRNFKANCPFHTEKTPSFFIFPERQSWHCFGACGTGGDIFTFVMKKENLDFNQALHSLAEKANVKLGPQAVKIPEEDKEKHDRLLKINEVTAEYFHYLLLHSPDAELARQYAQKRGLSAKIIENFQLGFALGRWDNLLEHLTKASFHEEDILAAGLIIVREGGGYYDRYRNRLIFPIRDVKGQVIGFGGRALDDSLPKYINSPQTLLFDKSSILYGIDRAQASIRQKDAVVITEGYMDTLTSHQYGFENTIASMGTALTEKQLDTVKKLTKNIILALDADVAGEEATSRSAVILQSIFPEQEGRWGFVTYTEAKGIELKVVDISDEGKDPDEVIKKDVHKWEQMIKDSVPLLDFIFRNAVAKINLNNAREKIEAIEGLSPLILKINDPIKKAHYIVKIAQLLKIDENAVKSKLFESQKKEKNKQNYKDSLNKKIKIEPGSSRYIEEYCLSLLLKFPDLRHEAINLSMDYFEHPENKDILQRWQESEDLKLISEKLDPVINDYFNYLLNYGKQFPLSLEQNRKERKEVLHDCLTCLRERYLKNLEIKKEMILAEYVRAGEVDQQIVKLIEHGIDESRQLKDVFKNRRRFFSRSKGA